MRSTSATVAAAAVAPTVAVAPTAAPTAATATQVLHSKPDQTVQVPTASC